MSRIKVSDVQVGVVVDGVRFRCEGLREAKEWFLVEIARQVESNDGAAFQCTDRFARIVDRAVTAAAGIMDDLAVFMDSAAEKMVAEDKMIAAKTFGKGQTP